MDDTEPVFVGHVSLSHDQISVQDLVSRLVTSGATSEDTDDEIQLMIPSLQREFCWDPEDIEKLFDSVLRGLPIGTLLVWDTEPDRNNEAKYAFIQQYANKANFPTDEVEEPIEHYSSKLDSEYIPEEYMLVLDGQQRLTSFLIGLKGSFHEHRYRKHTDKPESYYEKHLCLNILNDPEREPDNTQEPIFEFSFLREKKHGYDEEDGDYWWPVNNIWDEDNSRLVQREEIDCPEKCTQDPTNRKNARENIDRLHESLRAEQIPYELVGDITSKGAVELFRRRNKAGEELKNSDIAFSLITVYWKEFDENKDPKETFENEASELTENFADHSFSFGKQFFIRSLLYLEDEKPSLELENLVPEIIGPLENHWDDEFFDAINMTFELITEDFELTGKCISKKTSILPILYYCYERQDRLSDHSDIPEKDRQRMEYWVQMTVLNNIFSISSSMTVLDNVRKIVGKGIEEDDRFPLSEIVEEYQGRSVKIGISADEDTGVTITDIVEETDHSSATTVRNYLLTKLYTDRGVGKDFKIENGDKTSMEVDHFFPASKLRNNENYLDNQDFELSDENFKAMKEFCENNVNRFGNFTLLPHGAGNQSKGEKDPEKWLNEIENNEDVEDDKELHYLPQEIGSYSYENYEQFLDTREEMLIEELERKLLLAEEI